MPEIYKNRLTVAPRRVTGNTPKAASSWKPEQRVVLHFLFVQILRVMNRYKDETEKAIGLAKAQMKIAEFLKHDYSFTELMAQTAKAQAQVFNIISNVDPDKVEECNVGDISEFFYFAIKAFELLEPFSEDNVLAR